MKSIILLVACLLHTVTCTIYLSENFDAAWSTRWTDSNWKVAEGGRGKWIHTAGGWYGDASDLGLQTGEDYRFYTSSTPLTIPYRRSERSNGDLIIQYSVKNEQKWIECGGAFIKLLPTGTKQDSWDNNSPAILSFGPDLCGTQTKHVVATLYGVDGTAYPLTKPLRAETNKLTHFYTWILRRDGTYEIRMDNHRREMGDIAEDFAIPAGTQLRLEAKDISYAGFEIWQVRAGTIFDKILITNDIHDAEVVVEAFDVSHRAIEKSAYEAYDRIQTAEEERIRKSIEAQRQKQDEELALRKKQIAGDHGDVKAYSDEL